MKRSLISIQYLRGLAALAVVSFHASAIAGFPMYAGAAGVDVFFVISGFIMWSVSARESSPFIFVWRRITRIVPLYWIATFIMVVLNHPSLADLVRSLLFVPHFAPDGKIHPLLNPGWTLNYEMFFYAIFALILFLPRRYQLIVLTCVLQCLVWAGYMFRTENPALLVYTNNLLMEFAAGAVLCHFWQTGKMSNAISGWVAMAIGVFIFVLEQLFGLYSDAWRWILWGIPSVLVVYGALCVERAGQIKYWPILARIGDSSYSTYLFHELVVSAVSKIVGGPAMYVAAMIGGPLVGYVIWRLVEAPLTDFLKRIPIPGATTNRAQ